MYADSFLLACIVISLESNMRNIFAYHHTKSIYLGSHFRWKLPLEPVRINVCYYKANQHHFPHNFIFASDDESQDIWGLSEYEYPGMVKVAFK